ncbi:hypothetical protein L0222_03425 [bacterium]|nr:hypothetical protein [bacterium]MCI0606874.1 hypothetical protein [bacterium]
MQNNAGKLRVAASILLTLPGVPFLYYGEEVGIQNGPASGDESKRTPMPWDDSRSGALRQVPHGMNFRQVRIPQTYRIKPISRHRCYHTIAT